MKRSEGAHYWFQTGLDLDKKGNYEEAIACYDRSLALDPNFVEALANKGKTPGLLKRYNEAIEFLKRSIELEPTATAWSNIGNALMEIGRYEEAIACYDRSFEFNHTLQVLGIERVYLLVN